MTVPQGRQGASLEFGPERPTRRRSRSRPAVGGARGERQLGIPGPAPVYYGEEEKHAAPGRAAARRGAGGGLSIQAAGPAAAAVRTQNEHARSRTAFLGNVCSLELLSGEAIGFLLEGKRKATATAAARRDGAAPAASSEYERPRGTSPFFFFVFSFFSRGLYQSASGPPPCPFRPISHVTARRRTTLDQHTTSPTNVMNPKLPPAPTAAAQYPSKRARYSPPDAKSPPLLDPALSAEPSPLDDSLLATGGGGGGGGGGPGGKQAGQSSSFRNVSACNRCRLRKNKCDHRLPRCASCEKAGVNCVGYDPITKREIPRRQVAVPPARAGRCVSSRV